MAENIRGVYSILRHPRLYTTFQRFIFRRDTRRILVEDYIQPQQGDRVLDIGCGPASMLSYLGDVNYTGLDLEPKFIKMAHDRYGDRATFIEARVQELAKKIDSEFDIAIANGVLHHLDDGEARELFRATSQLLKTGGRLIAADGVFLPRQNFIARMILSLDRGKSVRTEEGYLALAGPFLQHVRTEVRSDFMRIPYDACVSVYQKRVTSKATL
jgi:SAM-dependent methyltransferase